MRARRGPALGPDQQGRVRLRSWVRPIGGVAILAVLLWRLGSGAFLDGLRLINGWAMVVALGVGVLTTVSSAWRWRLVADGLGVRLPLRTAVAHESGPRESDIVDINRGVVIARALGLTSMTASNGVPVFQDEKGNYVTWNWQTGERKAIF